MLAKGRSNKPLAKERLRELLDEQALLADVHGASTVAALCDTFLEDALHNLERRTYESYQYGCQKFVDVFAARAAHTIEPQDISKFARGLKNSLNATSQAIVLRTIERCFNWGVENRNEGAASNSRGAASIGSIGLVSRWARLPPMSAVPREPLSSRPLWCPAMQ